MYYSYMIWNMFLWWFKIVFRKPMKLLVDFRKWQLDATGSTGMFGIAGILLESPMQSGEGSDSSSIYFAAT